MNGYSVVPEEIEFDVNTGPIEYRINQQIQDDETRAAMFAYLAVLARDGVLD